MRSWSPTRVDATVAAVVLVLGSAEAATGQLDGPGWVAWTAVLVYVVAVLGRRASLWGSVIVAFAAMVVSYALGLSQLDFMASVIAALYLVFWVGYVMPRWESLLGFGYCYACVVATNDPDVPTVLWLLLVVGGAWGAGRALRSRRLLIEDLRRTTAELERSREELAERAVAEERLRIAREIHDVVAHSVTVMLVQAEAAERVMPEHPRARQALEAVQESGRHAITELRQLLNVLRVDEPDATGVRPQPGLRDLDGLVAQCAEAGLAVARPQVVAPPNLPHGVEMTAYRVAQEALTNVLRHSAAQEATLAVRPEDGELVVEVTDRGPAKPAAGPRGHGLDGMRERVEACGGVLTATPDGEGFRVRARLPVVVT